MKGKKIDRPRKKRRPYKTPRLVCQGTVDQVTQSGSGPSKDSAMGNPGGKS